jgi:hypothetical protein
MSLGATDKQRSLFLKGFKLSKQGNYEDPTYLGFKIVIDFGTLPINGEDGLPPSPLFRRDPYFFDVGGNFFGDNPFGQPQYASRTKPNGNIVYHSAQSYLRERESEFPYGGKRSDMLQQFSVLFNDILTNSPWFIQSIKGLDELMKVERPGYPSMSADANFNPQRTAGKTLEFSCLESINMRMTALADLYNQATFDYDNMRELLPRNLRRFTMYIFVSEVRNFFKTSRLIGSSAALTAIDNLSTLLGSGNNPGTNSGVADVAGEQNKSFLTGPSDINPASSFNSFVGNIFNQAGVDNDLSLLKNQQDQSGIKPMLVFECKNCEFDFGASTPIPNDLSTGSSTAQAETQSFKIHVGRVRMRNQYPNIRLDGKPLVLGDSWDSARSSVQKNPVNQNDILGIGGELLTNFVSNSLNDLINEGVANLTKNIAGLDKAFLGNAYSFNPSQILGNLSYNSAQNLIDQLGNANIGLRNTSLPNPQTMGQGGPPERVYPSPGGDAYPTNPGPDLGVPDRIYPSPGGDVYPTVEGVDLGVPDRVYPAPSGDEYPTVEGVDLGVPDRVYQAPSGDEYPTVRGVDHGVPERVYQSPSGDEYPTVRGVDHGVPERVYQNPSGDEYPTNPGVDLGVPDRVYPVTSGDFYPENPGSDLGVPQRVYPQINEDVYPTSPGNLGENNSFDSPPQRVYPEVPRGTGQSRGILGKEYPSTDGDFIPGPPLDLGNLKPSTKYNISIDGFNPESKDYE